MNSALRSERVVPNASSPLRERIEVRVISVIPLILTFSHQQRRKISDTLSGAFS